MLCASPQYLKEKGTPKTPQELQSHHCLTMIRGTEPLINWHLQTPNGLETVVIKAARSSNDGALVRQWALEGAGIALKSYIEVAEDIKAKRLVVILEDYMPNFVKDEVKSNSADLHVVYPSRQYQPKRVKAFIDAMLVYFEAFKSNS